jgi:hypothetical protein
MPLDDDEKVLFDIPLDGDTIERLMNLAVICRAPPREVAASLLRDLLLEDEDAHMLIPRDKDRPTRLN